MNQNKSTYLLKQLYFIGDFVEETVGVQLKHHNQGVLGEHDWPY